MLALRFNTVFEQWERDYCFHFFLLEPIYTARKLTAKVGPEVHVTSESAPGERVGCPEQPLPPSDLLDADPSCGRIGPLGTPVGRGGSHEPVDVSVTQSGRTQRLTTFDLQLAVCAPCYYCISIPVIILKEMRLVRPPNPRDVRCAEAFLSVKRTRRTHAPNGRLARFVRSTRSTIFKCYHLALCWPSQRHKMLA